MEKQKQAHRAAILASALLLVLFIAGCASPPPQPAPSPAPAPQNSSVTAPSSQPAKACTDQTCFISAANSCQNATLTLTEDVGTFQFSTSGCTLIKTLSSLDANETQQMKNALEGKSMTCKYSKGKFDSRLVTSLIFGMENCEGSLKDALGELLAFT